MPRLLLSLLPAGNYATSKRDVHEKLVLLVNVGKKKHYERVTIEIGKCDRDKKQKVSTFDVVLRQTDGKILLASYQQIGIEHTSRQ